MRKISDSPHVPSLRSSSLHNSCPIAYKSLISSHPPTCFASSSKISSTKTDSSTMKAKHEQKSVWKISVS